MKHFGNQLDEYFRKKKIVQKDFAQQLGVSEVTITKWKSQKSIDAVKLEKISKALNVPIICWFEECNEKVINQSIGDGSAASIYGDAMAGILSNKEEEVKLLDQIVLEKDKELAHLQQLLIEKERTIQILMKNNN